MYIQDHLLIATLEKLKYRYGQLSGMVEPVAGLFGTIAVVVRLKLRCVRVRPFMFG